MTSSSRLQPAHILQELLPRCSVLVLSFIAKRLLQVFSDLNDAMIL